MSSCAGAKSKTTSGALFYQNDSSASGTDTMWTRLEDGGGNNAINFEPNGTMSTGLATTPSKWGAQAQPLTARPCRKTSPSISAQRACASSPCRNNLLQGLELSQDGYPAGVLQDISNLERRTDFRDLLESASPSPSHALRFAQFAAPDMLKSRDGRDIRADHRFRRADLLTGGPHASSAARWSSRTPILPRNSAR